MRANRLAKPVRDIPSYQSVARLAEAVPAAASRSKSFRQERVDRVDDAILYHRVNVRGVSDVVERIGVQDDEIRKLPRREGANLRSRFSAKRLCSRRGRAPQDFCIVRPLRARTGKVKVNRANSISNE